MPEIIIRDSQSVLIDRSVTVILDCEEINIEYDTMACGSGACATAVAASITGRAGSKVTVKMDGGDLKVEWNPPAGHVYLSGPAEFVYEGDIECD